MRLKGKAALVTGAGRGIGRATAAVFAREGARVALCDVDGASAEAAAKELEGAIGLSANISSEAEVAALFATVRERLGRVDILVNNAGLGLARPIADTTLEEWDRIIGVNLTGTFLCCREAVRLMSAQRGGAIVNISSITAETGGAGRGAYGASKGGVSAFTRVLAVELAPFGARANAVLPGPVSTALSRRMHDAQTVAEYEARIPLARYGTEEEVANLVLFLASDEASYVTGQCIHADGGFNSSGLLLRK